MITGVKGSGKSHLAKVILLQLIEQGAPCLVFDINREYIHLPKAEIDPHSGEIIRRGIVHLEAGGNFRLGVRQFGLAPLMTLLQRYGLPEVSALYLENRLARLWEEAEAMEREGRSVPYMGLDQLIQMAEENEFGGGSSATVINHAIRSRLDALKNTHIFARSASEAASLGKAYRQVRGGGALVIDMSSLSNLAREGFVQAIIELVKDLCLWEIEHDTHRFPFIFFEEAHLYVSRHSIDYIVTRARHLGITSFFVTNMIHGLDEAVLRQADNLFLLRIPFEDDVRHVSRGAATDYETMAAFVRRLRERHALAIGNVTAQYPLIFAVDPLEGVNTAGETRYFFRSEAVRKENQYENIWCSSSLRPANCCRSTRKACPKSRTSSPPRWRGAACSTWPSSCAASPSRRWMRASGASCPSAPTATAACSAPWDAPAWGRRSSSKCPSTASTASATASCTPGRTR